MMSTVFDIKHAAHELIDSLPDEQVSWDNIVHLFQEKLEADDPLWAETEKGLADLDAGRVVDGDNVLRWIKSWGADNELAPPGAK